MKDLAFLVGAGALGMGAFMLYKNVGDKRVVCDKGCPPSWLQGYDELIQKGTYATVAGLLLVGYAKFAR